MKDQDTRVDGREDQVDQEPVFANHEDALKIAARIAERDKEILDRLAQ